MIFAILALFFQLLSNAQIILPTSVKTFYYLLLIACPFTYFGNVLHATPSTVFFWLNGFGNILQLTALCLFLTILKGQWAVIKPIFSRFQKMVFGVALLSFVLKVSIQSFTLIPALALLSLAIKNYMIGFLHLLLLGLLTTFLLGLAIQKGWLNTANKGIRLGIVSFILGIFLTESLLFLQGTLSVMGLDLLLYYHWLLFGSSLLLPFGVVLLVWRLEIRFTDVKDGYKQNHLLPV